jgi:hypothetical protein
MNNKTLTDTNYSSDLFGTILTPNQLSYDQLMSDGILKITSNIKDTDFMICYNFILKYLTKITGIKEFVYLASTFASDDINNSFNTNLSKGNNSNIDPFSDLTARYSDKFKYSKTPSLNSIVFYGETSTGELNSYHIGFLISIFGESWVISKFGSSDLYLHKPLSVPAVYKTPVCYIDISDTAYINYMRRIEVILEKQINKFKN